MDLTTRIRTSTGEEPSDLLLKNTRVINTLSGAIERTAVAIRKWWSKTSSTRG